MAFKQLYGTIEELSTHGAKVLLDDKSLPKRYQNQTLMIPKKLLPLKIHEGDILVLTLDTQDQATKSREAIARKLMEEILNSD